MLEIRHVHARNGCAERVARCKIAAPGAKLDGPTEIRAPERPPQAVDPVHRIGHRRRGRRGRTEHHGLRTVIARQLAEPRGDRVERFIPTDGLPAGIRIELRARSLERRAQPLRMVDELGRYFALDAQRGAGRMRRIRLQRTQNSIFDGRGSAAPRDAKRAERSNALACQLRHGAHCTDQW